MFILFITKEMTLASLVSGVALVTVTQIIHIQWNKNIVKIINIYLQSSMYLNKKVWIQTNKTANYNKKNLLVHFFEACMCKIWF